jgi:hypothetical protein
MGRRYIELANLMTTAEELTKLTRAYSAWLDAGCPASYTMEGTTVTRASAEWMSKRIDALRAAVARESSGSGFAVANFRNDN